MEKKRDQQVGAECRTQLVNEINLCLHSGSYSRALDLLQSAAAEFLNDAELSELGKLAQDGAKRSAEANRLITDSQELFAQQKSIEAIRLLREAYELDENNSLARTILANALVEHAQSIVESDWRAAETLLKQALELNPAHPTARTVRRLILEQKKTNSLEDFVSEARELRSSGDLPAALSRIAEGLAVYPRDPALLQMRDAIQRDQGARRRQTRRRDLEDLRRLQLEVEGAADAAAKQALAERIQAVAARYWTDGEIISVANGLMHRLGLAPQESSNAAPHSPGAPVIFHVPRPIPPKPLVDAIQAPASTALPSTTPASEVRQTTASPNQVPASPLSPSPTSSGQVPPSPIPAANASLAVALPTTVTPSPVSTSKVPPRIASSAKVATVAAKTQTLAPPIVIVTAAVPSAPAAKVASPSSQAKPPARLNSTALILVSAAAAIILVTATFFFTRRHYAPPAAKALATAPSVPGPTVAAPAASTPEASTPPVSSPGPTTPEPSLPDASVSSDTVRPDNHPRDEHPSTEPGRSSDRNLDLNLGTLLVVAGQDDARVFVNGKLQPQLTRAGQLRVPNLELKDYVVQVSKSGFQDPPLQTVRLRKGEPARLIFNLQPQPRLASLTIQGGAAGTTVLVDQTPVGTIPPDGTFSVSTVNPGDHTVELRRERCKARQFKKHFVAGGTISLSAADASLEAAASELEITLPGELKISFTPPDANVALVKGGLLKIVNSGVPLNLPAGTYTLTARTAEKFTRSATLEVVAGQSKTLDLSLAPNGMSRWDDPGAWKHEGDSFVRKGGDFVLYGIVPASGTFIFSALPAKGRSVQWVLNYRDPKNYVLCQIDDTGFYRTVIRNGEKSDEIKVADKNDKKSFRTLQIRVSPTELVHLIKHGESWTVLDRWTQPGANLSLGKFGFYIPGNDEIALSSFTHYADLNLR